MNGDHRSHEIRVAKRAKKQRPEHSVGGGRDLHEIPMKSIVINRICSIYDALATNEAAVRSLGDETLKNIAVELTQSLRKSVNVDWAVRETVRA